VSFRTPLWPCLLNCFWSFSSTIQCDFRIVKAVGLKAHNLTSPQFSFPEVCFFFFVVGLRLKVESSQPFALPLPIIRHHHHHNHHHHRHHRHHSGDLRLLLPRRLGIYIYLYTYIHGVTTATLHCHFKLFFAMVSLCNHQQSLRFVSRPV
jgi:hypothetical protein